MTEIWLVRHGQTDWNVEGRYQGQSDIPLNETGLSQAYALAEHLDGKYFAALYSSDLSRAHRTAEILGQRLGLAVELEPRLREINQGEWEGKNYREIVSRYAQSMEMRSEDPVNARAPGGESIAEVAARTAKALDEITQRHPLGSVLIVLHGLALATLTCQARGISLARVYDFIPKNAVPEVVTWPPVLVEDPQR